MRALWHLPPRSGARADVKPRRRGPSSRGYLALVNAWAKKFDRRVAKAIKAADPGTDEPLTEAQAKSIRAKLRKIRPPKTPSASRIAGVGKPVASDSLSAEHRALVKTGMPRTALLDRIKGDERADEGGDERIAGLALLMAGIGLPLIGGWSTDGADLIENMVPLERSSVQGVIDRSVVPGRKWSTVAPELKAIGTNARSSAQLIARDQTERLNAQIASNMQTAVGVEEYIWRAIRDNLTRDTHLDADGNKYRWDGPGAPDVGFYGGSAHPGVAGNCRCTAEPIPPKKGWGLVLGALAVAYVASERRGT